jgi:hypothetical protein
MLKHEFDPFASLDPTAAQPIYNLEDLTQNQYRILERTILRAYEIAEREGYFEQTLGHGEDKGIAYERHQYLRRPSQTYFVDGPRGSGKTSLIITLKDLLQYLGTGRPFPKKPEKYEYNPGGILHTIQDNLQAAGRRIGEPAGRRPQLPRLMARDLDLFSEHNVGGVRRRTAICLPVVHPADLESGQAVMEGLFALMGNEIEKEISIRKAQHDRQQEIDTLIDLKTELSEGVAKGWYLSRQAGTDAILRDSLNYKDYLLQIGEASGASHSRVRLWREYVNKFLDHLRVQVLVIFLDDADNRPEVTLDILHTIRIFLDHPRIMSVIAGNLRSVRQTLIIDQLRQISSAMTTLRRASATAEQQWRHLVRRNIEEFLEKVLPRANRFFLALDETKLPENFAADGGAVTGNVARGPSTDDYKRILGSTLDTHCVNTLDLHAGRFLAARKEAHLRFLTGQDEIGSDEQRLDLENYMSWWLFRFWYKDALKPKSIRQLLALRAYTLTNPWSPGISDRLPEYHRKRLPVLLFEAPENYRLIHRFGDHDRSVLRWLNTQDVTSQWQGARYIEINNVKLHSDCYSYQFLLYRVDLGIGLPVKERAVDQVPRGMLPLPSGPNLIDRQPFFGRIRPNTLMGIARQIRHSAIPANCYYFSGLQSLIDLSWETPGSAANGDAFSGHRLILEWPAFFHFEDADKPKEESHPPSPSQTESWVRSYLSNVVIPFGCIQAGSYIKERRIGWERPGTIEDGVENTLLSAELASGFFQDDARLIESSIRSLDYYDLVRKAGRSPGVSGLEALNKNWMDFVQDSLLTPSATKQSYKHIQSYQWILNDIRRAYHAGRIFLSEIDGPAASLNNLEDTLDRRSYQHSRSRYPFPRSRRYVVFSRQTLKRWLGQGRYLQLMQDLIKDWQESIGAETATAWLRSRIAFLDSNTGRANRPERFRNFPGLLPDYFRAELAALLKDHDKAGKEYQHIAGESPLNESEVELLLSARRPSDDIAKPWVLLLDPAMRRPRMQEGRDSLTQEEERLAQLATAEEMKSYIARSYFAFVNALAPALPAAMHLEVAASLYANCQGRHSQQLRNVRSALTDWRKIIDGFMIFVLRYWALLEIASLRQHIVLRLKEQKGSEAATLRKKYSDLEAAGVHLPLSPDLAFSTLGVIGPSAFTVSSKPILDGTLLPKTKMEKDRTENMPVSGELQDVLHNLTECINFADMLELAAAKAIFSRHRKDRSASAEQNNITS